MPTALLFFALLSWFSLTEGTPHEDETCVGMQREDGSYVFDLPNSVTFNVQNDTCDAEWTIDGSFTAVLEQNFIAFFHPFKEVTWLGIRVKYCPVSLRFHVSCPIYTKELMCYCTNSTDNNPVNNTSLPSRDILFSDSTKRHHTTECVAHVNIGCLLEKRSTQEDRQTPQHSVMADRNALEKLDFGALSPEQQEKLHQFKIKTRIDNERYLRSHPDVELLLSDFLRSVFLKRPTDIREFAADHFSDPGLSKKIQAQMNIHNK
ncbi:uncharacterized protein [Pseudorasbora parva]|uniref:uncharacterized protein isoform X2 n=1 Tax=Pseudorasbora parva TaxID=51549 RepID=UPI00351ECC80